MRTNLLLPLCMTAMLVYALFLVAGQQPISPWLFLVAAFCALLNALGWLWAERR